MIFVVFFDINLSVYKLVEASVSYKVLAVAPCIGVQLF